MSFSDIIALLNIVVTVLIGFVITHMVSLRDSRMRAMKDYYIDELAKIRDEICEFYSSLYRGMCSSQDIIDWHKGFKNRVSGFDESVRNAFNLHLPSLSKQLFANYRQITYSEEFNFQFRDKFVHFSPRERSRMGREEKELYHLLDQFLYDINHSGGPDFLVNKWQELSHHFSYYCSEGKGLCSVICVIRDWLLSHITRILILVVSIFLVVSFLANAKRMLNTNEEKEAADVVIALDSIRADIRVIANSLSQDTTSLSIESMPVLSSDSSAINSELLPCEEVQIISATKKSQ